MEIQKLHIYRSANIPTQNQEEGSISSKVSTSSSSVTDELIVARPITVERPSSLLSPEEKQFFLQQFPSMQQFLQEYFAFDQNGNLKPIDPGIGTLVDVRL